MQLRGNTDVGMSPMWTLHRRLGWVFGVIALFMALLLGRLWQLQILRGEANYERTVDNVIKERYLPAVRGRILDRRGVPLADNRPGFGIYAVPAKFTAEVRGALANLLGLSDEELTKVDDRIETGRKQGAGQPVLILPDQSRERATLIQEWGPARLGLEVVDGAYRYYPQGRLAAHLLGYMTQLSTAEYEALAIQGYRANEMIGRFGLEAAWENYLHGKKGIERYAVDAKHRRLDDKTAEALIDGPRVVPPVPGANVQLTIDAAFQAEAEAAVASHAAAAVAVVEVSTGRLLALVSTPTFDPNIMTGKLTKAEDTLLRADPRKPFLDKTVQVTYPPGSVFKFVPTFAALEDGQGAEDEHINCPGVYALADTKFRCNGVHGTLDLAGAIQHSCNVYFWELAARVGLDRLAQVAQAYGFGSPTNLGLNGDAPGRIPTKAWYEQRTTYRAGYATNAATGQGDVEVTVLQMAMAYAALANGGTLWVPQVVDKVVTNEGRVIVAFQPKVARQIRTSAASLEAWRKGMWRVANAPGGTAYAPNFSISHVAKTGTAEVRTNKQANAIQAIQGWHPSQAHAWFAGWAPAEQPEVAVVVLVEHGGSGGKVAAPVARKIMETYFQMYRQQPAALATPASGQAARNILAETQP